MTVPGPLRAGIVLWWMAALLLLLQTAQMWFERDDLARRLAEQRHAGLAEIAAAAQQLLVANTVFAVVFAAAYLTLGALMFRRHGWARRVLAAFALVHLVMVLGTGAVFGTHAVVLLIGVVAAVLTWRRPNTEWLTGER